MFSYCQHQHAGLNPQALALDMQEVCAKYQGAPKNALEQVSLSIPVGKCVALVGANGAGKSSLFKTISGFIPINSGRVLIFGYPLHAAHQHVAYLQQRSEVDWMFPMTVLELVLTGRYAYLGWFKNPGQADVAIALESLKLLGMHEFADQHISHLSGGQQQRVLISRALAQNADLLLLDEPLNAVDAKTRAIVVDVLKHLKQQGKTMIVATHYADEGDGLYDGLVYLHEGRISKEPNSKGHEGCCHD